MPGPICTKESIIGVMIIHGWLGYGFNGRTFNSLCATLALTPALGRPYKSTSIVQGQDEHSQSLYCDCDWPTPLDYSTGHAQSYAVGWLCLQRQRLFLARIYIHLFFSDAQCVSFFDDLVRINIQRSTSPLQQHSVHEDAT